MMSNAPKSLATTTPNALPPPNRRKTRGVATLGSPQQPDDLWPMLLEFYRSSRVARQCWAEEMAYTPGGKR